MKMLARAQCPDCPKVIRLKQDGTIRPHGRPANRCTGGGFDTTTWRVADTPEGPVRFAHRHRHRGDLMATDPTALTARQQSVLDYIQRTTGDRGFPPSYREIGEGVGLSSVASVAHQVKALERKGHLRRDAHRPRSVVAGKTAPVLIWPQDIAAIGREVRCPDCHEGRGIHLDVHGGAVTWDVVQLHMPDCPRAPARTPDTA